MTSPDSERAEAPASPGARFLTHLPRPPAERSGQRPVSRLNNCTDEARLLLAYTATLEAALIYEENEGGGGSHSWLARHIWFSLTNLEEELYAVAQAVKSAEGDGPPPEKGAAEEHTGFAGTPTRSAGEGPAGGRR